jgi:hypothetical protein
MTSGHLTLRDILPGDVLVTDGAAHDWVARIIQWKTGGLATHATIVTDAAHDEMVEAYFPRAKISSLSERIAEVEATGRGYVVLRHPDITDAQRVAIVARARSFVGCRYDVFQLLVYLLTRRFWHDGEGRFVCSRLVCAAYEDAGLPLFTAAVCDRMGVSPARRADLMAGYGGPGDLLFSALSGVTPDYQVEADAA